jgi:glucosamine kinase
VKGGEPRGSAAGAFDRFVGVDGGGTRCRVRVADAAGRLIGAAEGGASNVYLDQAAALATINDTVVRSLAPSGPASADGARISIALGLAGVSSRAVGEPLEAALQGRFGRVTVSNDAVIACVGAHAGEDGGLVIAGTGSAAVLRMAGHDLNIGGRGFLLGDDGSGAVMGRNALRRALRAHDGLEPGTPLLSNLLAEFADDPVALIQWGRGASSGQFAAFAPRILAAAEAGDAAARALVTDTAAAIGELIETLHRRGAPRIALVGGLAAPLSHWLPDAAASRLAPPLRDALDGALLLAGAPLPSARPSASAVESDAASSR